MLATCILSAGCGALEAEKIIAPTAVREAVQSRLGVALSETPSVDSVAALTDVSTTYALRTTKERLFVVVFDSPEATVQFTGGVQPSDGELVVVRNVVAVYEHEPGTISRLAQLRTALRSLDSDTAANRSP